MESHELYKRSIKAAGINALSRHLNLSPSHIYRMARDPMDVDNADGTGTRNDADRLEIVWELLATRGSRARAVLREWEMWTRAVFDRLLGRYEPQPLTSVALLEKTSRILHEVGDVVERAGRAARAEHPEEIDFGEIADECVEAMEVLDQLYRSAAAHRDGLFSE